MSKELASMIKDTLSDWREELLDEVYPNTISISAATLLGDDVIDQLVSCGDRVDSPAKLRSYTRWFMGWNEDGDLTKHGEDILRKLKEVYAEYDKKMEEKESKAREYAAAAVGPIPPDRFYGGPTALTSYTAHGLLEESGGNGHGRGGNDNLRGRNQARGGQRRPRGRPRGSRRARG